jgi:ketosteroid isomerase-like protein
VAEARIVCWEIEPLERPRRGLDERVALAAPGLTRRLLLRVMREPAGSARRRKLLTRALRSGTAANNRNDYDSMLAGYHPDVELIPPEVETSLLGLEPVYRGHAGVRDFFETWKSGFGDHRYELREVADAGGRHLAIRFGLSGTIGDSGSKVSWELGSVLTLDRNGLAVRHENFRNWEETLEALRRAAGGRPSSGRPRGRPRSA